MDIRLALMCGIDIPIPDCQLVIHQPKIKDIAYLGEKEFFTGVQSICINKHMIVQDKALLENSNNFQIYMKIMSEKETADKKMAVQQIMPLFFPNHKLMITPKSFVLKEDKNMIMIDENNFEYLQEAISTICCLRSGPEGQDSFNPADARAAEIAKKLMKGRQKVAEQKGETDSSIFSQYLSTLTIGLNSMSLQDLMNLTIYQLYDLIERYGLYTSWDIDVRSRLAGAKPESKPDNWMKNIL